MRCADFLPPTPVRGIQRCIALSNTTIKPKRRVVPVFALPNLPLTVCFASCFRGARSSGESENLNPTITITGYREMISSQLENLMTIKKRGVLCGWESSHATPQDRSTDFGSNAPIRRAAPCVLRSRLQELPQARLCTIAHSSKSVGHPNFRIELAPYSSGGSVCSIPLAALDLR